MANPERGEVALTVGDRTYTLVLDMNAICEVEELLSKPGELVTIGQVFLAAAHKSLRHLRALVWGALRRHHRDVSLSGAGDLLVQAGGPDEFLTTLARLREVTEPEGERRPRQARRSKAGARTTSTPDASA